MRTGMRIAVALVLLMLQTSCGTVDPVVTMTGEVATVQLRDGTAHVVELLAVEDSSILCLEHNGAASGTESASAGLVKEIPASSVDRLEVSGFRNSRWAVGVLCFQVLPAIGLTIAAGSADADAGAVFVVAMIPAAFTAILYAASGVPTPTFEHPVSSEDLRELRRYARFGGTLTPAQKEELLKIHGEPAADAGVDNR